VSKTNEGGLERSISDRRRIKLLVRQEGLQCAVGFLDAPAQFPPQAHQQVDAQEDDWIGLRAIRVLQGGQVKITTGGGIGKDQYLVEFNLQ
jgi:hypothetical protein